MKSRSDAGSVIPAKAGIHLDFSRGWELHTNVMMGPGVRRDDEVEGFA
jgi:hypothetical protein